jgi:hypothetical protein
MTPPANQPIFRRWTVTSQFLKTDDSELEREVRIMMEVDAPTEQFTEIKK